MQPVSARKYETNVKGREHATSASKRKMYPVRRTGNWYQAQETCNQTRRGKKTQCQARKNMQPVPNRVNTVTTATATTNLIYARI